MKAPIVVKPVVTEKSMRLASEGIFTFAIPERANKPGVRQAVQLAYKVHVIDVNIAKRPGKPKARGRVRGMTSPIVKALVRLKKGEVIPGYELNEPAAETKDESKKEKK